MAMGKDRNNGDNLDFEAELFRIEHGGFTTSSASSRIDPR